MKKFSLLFIMAIGSVGLFSQTLISYGNYTVSKDEFLRAYNKNKTPVTDKEKSLREYITLYSNFKLKVKAAQALRMDTLAQLQLDMDNFRGQVEENYMSDEKAMQAMMEEAFARSQYDLHVLHFSIPLDAIKPEDTSKAYENIRLLYNELGSVKNNYNAVAVRASAKSADLGFVTVFSLPYQYENIIYSLKPGEVSKPYRSKNAWHVFKLTEQRKSAGKWKVAQILFSYPPDANEISKAATEHLADSIYTLIKGGADFAEFAKTFSDDKLTYLSGGELPEFGTGKFDYSFEKEVFELNKDGDVSKPLTTAFGIHIVKRFGHIPMPTDKSDASLEFELKQKLMKDERISAGKEKFAKAIMSKIAYKRSDGVKDEDLFRYADTMMTNPSPESASQLPISNKTIISFKKSSLKGSDWLKFVRDYKTNYEQNKGESNKELWNKYITIASLDYYKKHLEEYNEDFKFQMQEFKEGNMLFEIMERNVWGKAANDSAGLLKYYKEHTDKYKWAASADVLIVNGTSVKVAEDVLTAMKGGKAWKEIIELHAGQLQIDSGRYELSQLNEKGNPFVPTPGAYSPMVKNSDGTATFIKYLTMYPADQQRNFEESRGLVINDYQNVLEQKWLAELQTKYPVKIHEPVLKTMLK